MSAFYIWIPSQLISNSREIYLTITNGEGTEGIPDCRKFYNYILELLKIGETKYRVQSRPVRNSYYSEYQDSENWEDRWPIVWRIKYTFPHDISIKWTNREQYIGIEKIFSCPVKLVGSDRLDCLFTAFYYGKTKLDQALKQLNILDYKKPKISVYKPLDFNKKKIFKMEIIYQKCGSDSLIGDSGMLQRVQEIFDETKGCYNFESL